MLKRRSFLKGCLGLLGLGTADLPIKYVKTTECKNELVQMIEKLKQKDDIFAQREPITWRSMYSYRILNDGPIQILETTA